MKVYIMAYCQNGYQEERVKNFLKTQDVNVLNPEKFCYKRGSDTYGNVSFVDGSIERIMQGSDSVWIILPSWQTYLPAAIEEAEKKAKKLQLPLRYFKINQTGRYVGRAKEVGREELVTN